MNNIQIFKNNEFGEVRTLVVEGEPWFVGKDVAESLGYAKRTPRFRAPLAAYRK